MYAIIIAIRECSRLLVMLAKFSESESSPIEMEKAISIESDVRGLEDFSINLSSAFVFVFLASIVIVFSAMCKIILNTIIRKTNMRNDLRN